MEMQKGHISVYKIKIKAPIKDVWEALTEPTLIKQYLFGSDIKTTWQVGDSIEWAGEYNGQPFLDKGIVLEYEPLKYLKYSYLSSWSGLDDKPENYLFVQYQVFEEADVTEFIVSQSNYDEEKAAHSLKSWEIVADQIRKMIEK